MNTVIGYGILCKLYNCFHIKKLKMECFPLLLVLALIVFLGQNLSHAVVYLVIYLLVCLFI